MYPVKSTTRLALHLLDQIADHVNAMNKAMAVQVATGHVYQDEMHDDYNLWVEQHHLPCITTIMQLLFRLPDGPLPCLDAWAHEEPGLRMWPQDVIEGALDVFLYMEHHEPVF